MLLKMCYLTTLLAPESMFSINELCTNYDPSDSAVNHTHGAGCSLNKVYTNKNDFEELALFSFIQNLC